MHLAIYYLPTDPRSSNAKRYLRRDEASNARGQILTSRFGSGDGSQAYQWLVNEYDASTQHRLAIKPLLEFNRMQQCRAIRRD
jgi:hypothetical protein